MISIFIENQKKLRNVKEKKGKKKRLHVAKLFRSKTMLASRITSAKSQQYRSERADDFENIKRVLRETRNDVPVAFPPFPCPLAQCSVTMMVEDTKETVVSTKKRIGVGGREKKDSDEERKKVLRCGRTRERGEGRGKAGRRGRARESHEREREMGHATHSRGREEGIRRTLR